MNNRGKLNPKGNGTTEFSESTEGNRMQGLCGYKSCPCQYVLGRFIRHPDF